MNYLLFFITSIFSGIFYIFYKLNISENINSLSGNLIIETIIFGILAFFLFLYFGNFSFKLVGKTDKYEENSKKNNIIKKINIKKILNNYIYYIGFLFFYSSIYFILKSFGITNFSYLIFFLNLIIFILFFISHKAELFKDFIKINTILFSLYYISIYLFIFFSGKNTLYNLDLVNTFFIFSFFIITFYFDFKKEKKDIGHYYTGSSFNNKKSISLKIDNSLILYFFIYTFIVFSFYFKDFFVNYLHFENINFSLLFIYISIFFNIIIYFGLQKLKILENSKYILRALSFLFLYISIISSVYFFIKYFNEKEFLINFLYNINNLLIIFILIYSMIFNFRIHKKFQNYISLFFSVFSFVFILNFLMIKSINIFGESITNLELILNFTLSFFIIIFTYLYKQKYTFDYFFLHFFSYFVNFLGIMYYFIYGNFEFLNLGIILLLNSVFIFLSYFKLKNIEKVK